MDTMNNIVAISAELLKRLEAIERTLPLPNDVREAMDAVAICIHNLQR